MPRPGFRKPIRRENVSPAVTLRITPNIIVKLRRLLCLPSDGKISVAFRVSADMHQLVVCDRGFDPHSNDAGLRMRVITTLVSKWEARSVLISGQKRAELASPSNFIAPAG